MHSFEAASQYKLFVGPPSTDCGNCAVTSGLLEAKKIRKEYKKKFIRSFCSLIKTDKELTLLREYVEQIMQCAGQALHKVKLK